MYFRYQLTPKSTALAEVPSIRMWPVAAETRNRSALPVRGNAPSSNCAACRGKRRCNTPSAGRRSRFDAGPARQDPHNIRHRIKELDINRIRAPLHPKTRRLSHQRGRLQERRRHVYTVYMNREPTSRRIATAARELLDTEGVEAVTMRRVASAVGITAMAVYRHYADRDALLNALADEGFTELAGKLQETRLEGELESGLRKVLDANLDFALASPKLFELMF